MTAVVIGSVTATERDAEVLRLAADFTYQIRQGAWADSPAPDDPDFSEWASAMGFVRDFLAVAPGATVVIDEEDRTSIYVYIREELMHAEGSRAHALATDDDDERAALISSARRCEANAAAARSILVRAWAASLRAGSGR